MSGVSLADRLAALLVSHAPGAATDSDEGVSADLFDKGVRDAAVLIAFVDRPEPTLLLTRRTDHLSNHAGQVAFPGGRVDAGDADIHATALREAEEEIGLDPALPRLVGTATPYLTGTGFRVVPVVAVIPSDLALVPQEDEVAAIFEVRADILFDPANHSRKSLEWKGRMRSFYEIAGHDEYIWGATAGMIVSLGAKLGLAENPRLLNRVGP